MPSTLYQQFHIALQPQRCCRAHERSEEHGHDSSTNMVTLYVLLCVSATVFNQALFALTVGHVRRT